MAVPNTRMPLDDPKHIIAPTIKTTKTGTPKQHLLKPLYEPLSKLLVSPLVPRIMVLYIIPYITPL